MQKNMKKVMKKLISTMLVLTMILTSIIPATYVNAQTMSGKGEDKKGSITIDNAIVEKTYTIYRIFDLESYSYDQNADGTITNKAFVYKVSAKWVNFINQETIKGVYVEVDKNGVVTWKENAKVEEFAKLAIAYAKDKNHPIDPDKSQKATTTTIKFEDLTLGYYLVDSTVGSICSLNTTKPDVTIEEKNTPPEIKKEVKDSDTNEWGKENNAQIGDKIEYKTVISVKEGAQNYKLTDTMTEGLTPNQDVTVTDKNGIVSASDSTYKITYTVNGFTIEFKDEYLETLVGTQITVTYSATLNEKAAICKTDNCAHNDNETYLEYGDNNKTTESKTETYTYRFTLIKTKENGETLEGAEFLLYDAKTEGNVIKVFKVSEGVYRIAKTEDELKRAESIKAGTAIIEGLDSDKTYYLEETIQPAGYNRLTAREEVKVKAKTNNGTTSSVIELEKKVINKTGNELPSTGGMGTVLFVTIGSLMVLAFGVLLVTKLRLSKMSI